jgi:hypothetical protein
LQAETPLSPENRGTNKPNVGIIIKKRQLLQSQLMTQTNSSKMGDSKILNKNFFSKKSNSITTHEKLYMKSTISRQIKTIDVRSTHNSPIRNAIKKL